LLLLDQLWVLLLLWGCIWGDLGRDQREYVGQLLCLSSIFIRIPVDPLEPSPALCHILDHYEVVAPASGILYPELEAKVLEFDLIELEYLVDKLLVH